MTHEGMELLFTRSKWDMPEESLDRFLQHIQGSGFKGSEIFLPALREPPEEVIGLHQQYGLNLVAMIATDGQTPKDHLHSLHERFVYAAKVKPVHINCHTGRDCFPLEDNLTIFRRSLELSADYGISISHETHRGRATYSTLSTKALLAALPDIRLTADFSHWCCVHESLLADQEDVVMLAIQHADYIHARVGYIEGPQISDPRAPEWKTEVETHLGWWKKIVDLHRRRGSSYLAICPEFGPPPYMQQLAYTQQPVANLEDINVYMMHLISDRFGSKNLHKEGDRAGM